MYLGGPGAHSLCQNLYWFARAAITTYDSLGGLNNKILFLTVLEARKSKITF